MVAVREAPISTITYSLEIEERIAELEAEVTSSREAYNGLSERYNELTHEYEFVKRLFEVKSDTLTISHKASTFATVQYLRAHERDRDERGYIKMDPWEVAAMAGQSYGTVLTNWGATSREMRIRDGIEVETDIGRVPLFDRLVIRVPSSDRERYPQGYYLETYMKERTILSDPEHYRAQTPIEWGGKRKDAGRKKCKKCNVWMKAEDHIRTAQREHICPNCHTHEWDEVRRVSADVVLVNEPVEQPEASKNQLDFCSPDPLDEEEIEASKPQLDEVPPPSLLHQVANTEETALTLTHALMPPAELHALPIWCPWRYEEPDKPGGKPKKVPYNPVTGSKAESDNPATWGTYEQAQARLERSQAWAQPYDGIGFMCDGSFVGIDLDHCRNKETGEIAAWAQAIIDRFPSCGYVTPSEEGVRLVIHAKKPGPKCKKGDIEVYEERRFFTWRPERLSGSPDMIVDCQAELDMLYAEVFPPVPAPTSDKFLYNVPCSVSDEKVLEKARGAANGAKFSRLWAGDWSGYPSQSEADLALCKMLAHWTDNNVSTIRRLFEQSGLMRDKWHRNVGAGETYGERTISRAMGAQERRAS